MFNLKQEMEDKGKKFEELVHYVYQSLLSLEGRDIQVSRDIKILGKSGSLHQIDAFYEFELVGVNHKVAIECKNHARAITKGSVQEFYAKLNDLDNCIGIMVSSSGFQEGAEVFAKHYGIELLSLGELPLLTKVISAKIGVILPNEKVLGQPFWTLMEENNGQVTGSYIIYTHVKKQNFYLFLSKKTAEVVCEKAGGVVRGISHLHLRVLISFAELHELDFIFFPYDEKLVLKLTYEDVKGHFLYI
ncbi:restriction endonuclease [Paenibacillus sp. JX-17]|uniref:Restriction endonuclease n=1 Tax=Paenibacillus lacisoli TaxID=3064525 RepID=A0ABT9CJM1_9BACL|nr:restriction endonuclease [Paenibacillus sp. JX-17]MDO7908814.1 restriction endonuclease [Paenibacillus sp. JX-17]